MDFLQGRSKRDGEAYIVSYVESLSAARTKQKSIFTSLKTTSLHPDAQGRRLQQLRGTTLIQPEQHASRSEPFIMPTHGGETEPPTSSFRDSARRRVPRCTGWFAPSTSSLRSVLFAYCSSSQPFTDCVVFSRCPGCTNQLRLRFERRQFRLPGGLFPNCSSDQPDHSLNRTHQGIGSEDYK